MNDVHPYELIVTSAARPHLLGPTLATLFGTVDQNPERVLINDDDVFPGRAAAVSEAVEKALPPGVPREVRYCSPPARLGPAVAWLLSQVRTEYVLYSQDDFVAVRPLPIQAALGVMHTHGLHHIRFNKRTTMDRKGDWRKIEMRFGATVLTVSDHWYFQTSLWRVAPIRAVVDWWMAYGAESFAEHAEAKINDVFNGKWSPGSTTYSSPYQGPAIPDPARWDDQKLRAEILRTFIWGGIGEPQYVRHIGDAPEDWALVRNRRG